MTTKVYRLDTRKELTLTEELGAGGEGTVLEVHGQPGLVAKVFRKPDSTRSKKLAAMLNRPPVIKGHRSFIAWPVALLGRRPGDTEVAGYLMPAVRDAREIARYYNPSLRRQTSPFFNYRYLVNAAANVAVAVHALHERGYVIGDFNANNVRVKDDTTVTLIDTDSFQVTERRQVYFCTVGTPEYTPPELIGSSLRNVVRTAAHDSFGLGVLFFQLLMEGQHPLGGKYLGSGEPPALAEVSQSGVFPYGRHPPALWRPAPLAPDVEILPNHLRDLFELCFVDGFANPSSRPDALRWYNALRACFRALQQCAHQPQHYYRTGLNHCPWCARREQLGGRDPFPSEGEPDHPGARRPDTRRPRARGPGARRPSRAPRPVRSPLPSSPFHSLPTPWSTPEVRPTSAPRRRPSTITRHDFHHATWITVLRPLRQTARFKSWPLLLASIGSFLGFAIYPQAAHQIRVFIAKHRADARVARPLHACARPAASRTCAQGPYRVRGNEPVRLIAENEAGWVKIQLPHFLKEAYVHRLDLTATDASEVPLSRLVALTGPVPGKDPVSGKTRVDLTSGSRLPLVGTNGAWACLAHPAHGVLAVRSRNLHKLPPPRVLKPEVPCPERPEALDFPWKPNARLWRQARRVVNTCSRPLINAKCIAPHEARQYASGTRIQVIEKGAEGWYRIRAENGDEGWVYGSYIVLTDAVRFEPWTIAKPRHRTVQAYSDARLRHPFYRIRTSRVVVDAGGRPPVFRVLKPSGGEAFVPKARMRVVRQTVRKSVRQTVRR